jgi:kinesin family member C2/C3
VCVFAYGQTGSGKTHTMEGPPNDPGINFRTMQELFRVIDTERRASHKHTISASIVEIYNEMVRGSGRGSRWFALIGWLVSAVVS